MARASRRVGRVLKRLRRQLGVEGGQITMREGGARVENAHITRCESSTPFSLCSGTLTQCYFDLRKSGRS